MQTCIHACIHAFVHVYIYTCICMPAYKNKSVFFSVGVCVCVWPVDLFIWVIWTLGISYFSTRWAELRTQQGGGAQVESIYICMYIYANVHTCMHTCMHSCVRTYIHTCMHMYACLRVYIRVHLSNLNPGHVLFFHRSSRTTNWTRLRSSSSIYIYIYIYV